MCHISSELKRWGNNLAVIIPEEKVKELGLSENDKVDLDIVKKQYVDGFGICKGAQPFIRDDEDDARF